MANGLRFGHRKKVEKKQRKKKEERTTSDILPTQTGHCSGNLWQLHAEPFTFRLKGIYLRRSWPRLPLGSRNEICINQQAKKVIKKSCCESLLTMGVVWIVSGIYLNPIFGFIS